MTAISSSNICETTDKIAECVPPVWELNHADTLRLRPDLVRRQLALEEDAQCIAMDRADENVERLGVVAGSATVKAGLKPRVDAVAKRIDEWIEEQKSVRNKPKALKYIKTISAHACAYATLRTCVESILGDGSGDGVSRTRCSTKIAARLKEAAEYEMFSDANPRLARKLESQLSRSASERHRRAVIRAGLKSADFEGLSWDQKDLLGIGFTLIQCALEKSGLLEQRTIPIAQRSKTVLVASDELIHLIESAAEADPILSPFRLPMVIPPKPWTDAYNGGYIDEATPSLGILRVRREAMLAEFDAAETADVLDAVNTIQATPWRINNNVLAVFEEALEGDLETPAVIGSEAPGVPPKPWEEGEEPKEDVLSAWKAEASDAYRQVNRWTSKRIAQQQKLSLARRFADDEALYFPHTLDFRGRVYPAAGMGAVSPQGDDVGKALLEFAEGKPVTDEGYLWLLIHAANSFGVDKVSLTDRALWAEFHADAINFCAADPFMCQFWMKADKPWAFLAACFELAGYWADPEGFLSHLPVAVDGSCSGLQHFGAMMLCEKTADAVNLRKTDDKPSDVYSVVLSRVKQEVDARASSDPIAAEWSSRLRRDTVKQPVMTTPYGVTKRGVVGQIMDNTSKLIAKGRIPDFESVSLPEAAVWLGDVVQDAISTELTAAETAMSWLSKCATALAKHNLPMYWTTPVGFPAVQDYRNQTKSDVWIRWAGQKIKIKLSNDLPSVSTRKQGQGAAPNFVHSMDAAHLMVTVNNAAEYGISAFAVVHDSFGCHASDVPLLVEILKESFIALYSMDTLDDLYSQVQRQMPPETILPPPPERGSFDLSAVRDSSYFFA